MVWNALDKRIVNAQSVDDFKTMIQTWRGITCSCTVCKSCCLNNMIWCSSSTLYFYLDVSYYVSLRFFTLSFVQNSYFISFVYSMSVNNFIANVIVYL